MKIKIIISFVIATILISCISVPKETVSLSKEIGDDLVTLQNAQRNVIELYYGKIKEDITVFVDDVYAPFMIHYVLKVELEKYKKGAPSLFTSITNAGETGGKAQTAAALSNMQEFLEAANSKIQFKRNELLTPIIKQEKEIIGTINTSYANVMYANSTITNYLISVKKTKESQEEALSLIGLKGSDTLVTNSLVKVSEIVDNALKKGKEIDIKSDDAYSKMEELSKQIKKLTTKN
jgi:hypothetical protein